MTETASPEAPVQSPFERVGGHAALQAITNRFYDLMEQDPAYAELRAMHSPGIGGWGCTRASSP